MSDERPVTLRWARLALGIGALLLAAAVALTVWDAADSEPEPPVLTGNQD